MRRITRFATYKTNDRPQLLLEENQRFSYKLDVWVDR